MFVFEFNTECRIAINVILSKNRITKMLFIPLSQDHGMENLAKRREGFTVIDFVFDEGNDHGTDDIFNLRRHCFDKPRLYWERSRFY